jgi:hypothetical protein
MTPTALETIYTLVEAAEKMRLKPRALAAFARERGFCAVHGRTVLFSESDLVAIWEAMRCEPSPDTESKFYSSPNGKVALQMARITLRQRPGSAPSKRPK